MKDDRKPPSGPRPPDVVLSFDATAPLCQHAWGNDWITLADYGIEEGATLVCIKCKRTAYEIALRERR